MDLIYLDVMAVLHIFNTGKNMENAKRRIYLDGNGQINSWYVRKLDLISRNWLSDINWVSKKLTI